MSTVEPYTTYDIRVLSDIVTNHGGIWLGPRLALVLHRVPGSSPGPRVCDLYSSMYAQGQKTLGICGDHSRFVSMFALGGAEHKK